MEQSNKIDCWERIAWLVNGIMEEIVLSIVLPDFFGCNNEVVGIQRTRVKKFYCNRISLEYSQTHGNYNHKIPSEKL